MSHGHDGPGDPEGRAAARRPTVLDDTSAGLARVYAEALLNAAEKSGEVGDVLDELDAIDAGVFQRFPAFAELVSSPARTAADRDRVLVSTFEGRTAPTVLNFLRVLNRHGRLDQLTPIAAAARAGWDRRQNRRQVTVHSAVPLSDAQRAALVERLGGQLAATPVLRTLIDPALIGGLVVQVGDQVFDGSVRNRLEQLRTRLIEGKSHEIQSRRDHFSHPE